MLIRDILGSNASFCGIPNESFEFHTIFIHTIANLDDTNIRYKHFRGYPA